MTRSSEDNMASVAGEVNQMDTDYGKYFKILLPNDQIKGDFNKHIVWNFSFLLRYQKFVLFSLELQTILRDKSTDRSDFKFYADRLIRLVIEESLNQLPYSECSVVTPTGLTFDLKLRSLLTIEFFRSNLRWLKISFGQLWRVDSSQRWSDGTGTTRLLSFDKNRKNSCWKWRWHFRCQSCLRSFSRWCCETTSALDV